MVAGLTAQQAGHESSPSRWRVRCAIYDVDNCGAISRNHLELEVGKDGYLSGGIPRSLQIFLASTSIISV